MSYLINEKSDLLHEVIYVIDNTNNSDISFPVTKIKNYLKSESYVSHISHPNRFSLV